MRLLTGDAYERLKDVEEESVQCCVTSPPYWGLRDYKCSGQIGLEKTPDEYINKLVRVFNRVKWALRKDGTLWVVIGDSYSRNPAKGISGGVEPKELIGIPWRFAFALQKAGWYLRQDIIWSKPNPMPESVRDRCTRSHEYIFLFSRSANYFYDWKAIQEPFVSDHGSGNGFARDSRLSFQNADGSARGKVEQWQPPSYNGSSFDRGKTNAAHPNTGTGKRNVHDGRNRRDVWSICAQPYRAAHFATFPESLVRTCLLAGSKLDSLVLDPFSGSGTVAKVCRELSRDFIGIELNTDYQSLAIDRIGERWFLTNHALSDVDWDVKRTWK